MMKNSKKGFTLIELLVVIAIIGILASVVMASLNSARKKSRDARRIADLKQVQLANEMYFDAVQNYVPGTALALLVPTYIPVVPTAPTPGSYSYQALDGGLTPSACGVATCAFSYVLRATLEESGNPALTSDIDGTVGGVACDDPFYCIRP